MAGFSVAAFCWAPGRRCPELGSDDARPVAVATAWLRAWRSCLLRSLPLAPDGAWGEKGAVRSFADWAAAPGEARAEVDMQKACDSVAHRVAVDALLHQGAPPAMVRFLAQTWWAPRFCSVGGLP